MSYCCVLCLFSIKDIKTGPRPELDENAPMSESESNWSMANGSKKNIGETMSEDQEEKGESLISI